MPTLSEVSLPQSANYTVGAVRYEVQAVFSNEGPALDEKVKNLLRKMAQNENRTFANAGMVDVK